MDSSIRLVCSRPYVIGPIKRQQGLVNRLPCCRLGSMGKCGVTAQVVTAALYSLDTFRNTLATLLPNLPRSTQAGLPTDHNPSTLMPFISWQRAGALPRIQNIAMDHRPGPGYVRTIRRSACRGRSRARRRSCPTRTAARRASPISGGCSDLRGQP